MATPFCRMGVRILLEMLSLSTAEGLQEIIGLRVDIDRGRGEKMPLLEKIRLALLCLGTIARYDFS